MINPEIIQQIVDDTKRKCSPTVFPEGEKENSMETERMSAVENIAATIRVGLRSTDIGIGEVCIAAAILALETARAERSSSVFYVIERFEDGRSMGYWDGGSERSLFPDIDMAIQFRRRRDAIPIIRPWHRRDCQITEHICMDAGESEPDPRSPTSPTSPKPIARHSKTPARWVSTERPEAGSRWTSNLRCGTWVVCVGEDRTRVYAYDLEGQHEPRGWPLSEWQAEMAPDEPPMEYVTEKAPQSAASLASLCARLLRNKAYQYDALLEHAALILEDDPGGFVGKLLSELTFERRVKARLVEMRDLAIGGGAR